MRSRLILALLLLASPSAANDWPTNVINVVCSGAGADSSDDIDCSGLHAPFEQCVSSGVAVPTLNGCDGADIMIAIAKAQLAGGGIVRMPCASTFENAENNITPGTPDLTDWHNGVNYNTPGTYHGFPNGLIIEGCGATGPNATILKSRIPPAHTPMPTAAIFYTQTWDRDSGTAGFQQAIPKLWLRNFQCDGQSNKQPSYMHRTAGLAWGYENNTYLPNIVGAYDAMEDFHACYSNRAFWSENQMYGAIWITGVYAHHFVGGGITPMAVGGANTLVAGNTIENTGCWQSFSSAQCVGGTSFNANCTSNGKFNEVLLTDNNYDHSTGKVAPCCTGPQAGTCNPFLCCGPGATYPYDGVTARSCDVEWANGIPVVADFPCGVDYPGGIAASEWNIARESNEPISRSPGFKKYGFSTYIGGPGKILQQSNTVSRSAKYGLACASDWNPVVGALKNIDMCRIDDNYMTQASIFGGTHGSIYWFSNNSAHGGFPGELVQAAEAIGFNGMATRIWVNNNRIRNGTKGAGIRDWGWPSATYGKVDFFRVIADNVFETNVSEWADEQNAGSEMGPLVVAPHLVGCGSTETPANIPEETYILRNTVTSGYSGMGMSLFQQPHNCPTYYGNPLTIAGNDIGYTGWAGHTTLTAIRSAKNINAYSNTLRGPGTVAKWLWQLGYLGDGPTGGCSGFTMLTGALAEPETTAPGITNPDCTP